METNHNSNKEQGNPNTSILNSALFYSAIATIIVIATSFAGYYTKWNSQSTSNQLMGWVILIGVIIWTLWHFKKNKNNNFLRYGQGVGLSVLTGLFTGIFSGIFTYFFAKYVHTGLIDEVLENMYNKMVDQGESEKAIEKVMEMTAPYITPGSMAIGTLFFWTVIALIVGLIASAILKRD